MKKVLLGLLFVFLCVLSISFRSFKPTTTIDIPIDSLRNLYSGPLKFWPKPNIDPSVKFVELGILPNPPFTERTDSVKTVVQLGKVLFFDPRLSGSNQISCASCHAPDLNWADGREVSVGNDHKQSTRNSPSLQNIWANKKFFWDGRADKLEQQVTEPLSSPIEMHENLKTIAKELSKIKGYKPLFTEAFGDAKVTNERIYKALSYFQQTITSRPTDFDAFLKGDKTKLTDEQVLGLHLFRTKARCINCHNGPLFTDGDFHNMGLTYYGRDKYEDFGLYNHTKKPEDMGKFKTPSLRDVMRTGPWFHNGLFPNMEGVIGMYNAGMPRPLPTKTQINDPLFPVTDIKLKKLDLTKDEQTAIIAFLNAISTTPYKVRQPELPQ